MEIEEKIENNQNMNNEIINDIANNEVDIEKSQNSFFESTLGKVINTGCDIALRTILPNVIEDEVIEIKNVIFNEGIKSGIKTAIDSAINMGKSAMGIVTGKFENVSQAYNAIKSGGLIDNASKVIDNAVKAAKDNNLINPTTAKLITKGKNVVKDCITSGIEENFMEQVDGIEKVGKYINNWNNYLNQKDIEGMNREYGKIKKKLENLIPLETTLKEARTIENIQAIVKSKGNSLENISEDEIKLARMI
ncbi:MAG: hypothetical protein HFJ54_04310 [Clostridia bacterium]|nr:hypothetical protein [Clostridia bacterium]